MLLARITLAIFDIWRLLFLVINLFLFIVADGFTTRKGTKAKANGSRTIGAVSQVRSSIAATMRASRATAWYFRIDVPGMVESLRRARTASHRETRRLQERLQAG
ncbi:MAG: hypothetical protein R3D34_09130 [Nitratireductor sp.]